MTLDDNKTIATRFLQTWSAGGERIVDELAGPEFVVHYSSWPEPVYGPESFKEILSQTFSYFPDMQIMAHELLVENDKVVVRWSYTGTHKQGELFGHQASGKHVQVSGMTIYRIAGGKVIEERGIVDSYSLMLQISADLDSA